MPGYGYSGKPTTTGWDARPHRTCLGRADEAPWLHEIRRARRRLGCGHHGTDGRAGAAGVARHSHQHARRRFRPTSTRRLFPVRRRQRVSQPTRRSRTSDCSSSISKGDRLRLPDGVAPADAVRQSRIHPSAWRRISSITTRAAMRSSRASLTEQSEGLTRDDILDNITITWLTNTAVSGGRLYWENWGKGVFQRQRRLHPGCRERLSRRALSSAAELGGAGVSQTDPLQQGGERRALRGLGTAAALLRRGSRRLQIAARIAQQGVSSMLRRGWPITF